MRTARLPDGTKIEFQSNAALAALQREFFAERPYEVSGIRLNDGDVIFDVGANIGFFSLYLDRTLQHARVYCFEPIPETFEALRSNLAKTRLDVRLFNAGLADRPGRATFKHFPRMSVSSSMCFDDSPRSRKEARKFVLEEIRTRNSAGRLLVRCVPYIVLWPVLEMLRRWGTKAEEVECELRTLAEVMSREGVERIDLLKLDVEGAEEMVLNSIPEEYWSRIRQIVVETHFWEEQALRVAAMLQKCGFTTQHSRSLEGVDHLYLVTGVRANAR